MQYMEGWRVAIGFTISMVLLSPLAVCQHPVGGAAGGAPNGGRTTPAPLSESAADPTVGLLNRGPYLSGKVQLEDGTPPPGQVLIKRICSGSPTAEGYTDLKGRFSFRMGQEQGVTDDASLDNINGLPRNGGDALGSAGGTSGMAAERGSLTQRLIGCELVAALPGFRSDSISLSTRRSLDNPDVGTIVLHRLANVEGSSISVTTLQAPKDARKAYDKSREAFQKGKIGDAQKDLEKAVSLYPQFAAAWNDLGVIHEKANDFAEARKCYTQAIAADPKFISPYLPLARISGRDKSWQEVDDITERLIKLDPADFPEAYYYNAAANYNVSKTAEAEASARAAQKLDTAHLFPQTDHILGLILYQKKDYTGAAEQLRRYLIEAPNAPDTEQVRAQLAEVEKLTAKANGDKP